MVLKAVKTHNRGVRLVLGFRSPLRVVFSTTCLTAFRSNPAKRPQGIVAPRNGGEQRLTINHFSVFRLPSLGTAYLSTGLFNSIQVQATFFIHMRRTKGITQHSGDTENGFRDISRHLANDARLLEFIRYLPSLHDPW
jgi:hypothetical protein